MTLKLNNPNDLHNIYMACDTRAWVGKCSVWHLHLMIKPDDWRTFESVGS